MSSSSKPDYQIKVARQAIQPDGSFGTSPVTSRFANLLSDPRYQFRPLLLVVIVVLSASSGLYSLNREAWARIALIGIGIVGGLYAIWCSRRVTKIYDHTYRQFKLFRDRLELIPKGPSLPYAKLDYVRHQVYRAQGRGALEALHEMQIATGGIVYEFRWSSPSLQENSLFDDNLDTLLEFLGFRDAIGTAQLTYDPALAPDPGLDLSPLPPGLMNRPLNPLLVLAVLLLVAGVVYLVWKLVALPMLSY